MPRDSRLGRLLAWAAVAELLPLAVLIAAAVYGGVTFLEVRQADPASCYTTVMTSSIDLCHTERTPVAFMGPTGPGR